MRFYETNAKDESTRMLFALWFLRLVSKKPHHATLSKKARKHSLVSKKPLAVVSLKPSEKPSQAIGFFETKRSDRFLFETKRSDRFL